MIDTDDLIYPFFIGLKGILRLKRPRQLPLQLLQCGSLPPVFLFLLQLILFTEGNVLLKPEYFTFRTVAFPSAFRAAKLQGLQAYLRKLCIQFFSLLPYLGPFNGKSRLIALQNRKLDPCVRQQLTVFFISGFKRTQPSPSFFELPADPFLFLLIVPADTCKGGAYLLRRLFSFLSKQAFQLGLLLSQKKIVQLRTAITYGMLLGIRKLRLPLKLFLLFAKSPFLLLILTFHAGCLKPLKICPAPFGFLLSPLHIFLQPRKLLLTLCIFCVQRKIDSSYPAQNFLFLIVNAAEGAYTVPQQAQELSLVIKNTDVTFLFRQFAQLAADTHQQRRGRAVTLLLLLRFSPVSLLYDLLYKKILHHLPGGAVI